MVGIVIVFAISLCGNNVFHADEFDLVITVAVLGIVTDSIDDNCDGDTSGNIV